MNIVRHFVYPVEMKVRHEFSTSFLLKCMLLWNLIESTRCQK